MDHQLLRASRLAFSATTWIIFGVGVWQMGFSVGDVVRFGQQMTENATFKGEMGELVQSGFLP